MPTDKPSRREEIAAFRLGIVGDLLTCDLTRGELTLALKERAERRYRPPGAETTRTYSWKTLQRWYYAAQRGPRALKPRPRRRGNALALTADQRALILEVRRAYPSASAELILSELVRQGIIDRGTVSVSTVRRLLRHADLPRGSNNRAQRRRLRWTSPRPGYLWHADVCHIFAYGVDGIRRHYCVHGILDDHSRALVALEVRATETERDLLEVLASALLRHPAPAVFFVDNGSCYRGNVLSTACQRLGIRLVHAKPYDPEARGKMERLWRTMRQQCTDHLGPVREDAEVSKAVHAWMDAYHRRPHGGLMGKQPLKVYREGIQGRPHSPAELARALEITAKRRVAKDATLSVDGALYEVGGHLAGKTLTVRTCGLTGAVLGATYQDRDVPIGPCDPTANQRRSRPAVTEEAPRTDLPFHPVAGLIEAARSEDLHD